MNHLELSDLIHILNSEDTILIILSPIHTLEEQAFLQVWWSPWFRLMS